MVRVQVQLDPAQHRQIKQQARKLGVSVAEIVRRSVAAAFGADQDAGRDERIRRALAVCGKYRDGGRRTDVARRHDDVLAGAYRR
jgi:hypothetical protein